MNYQYKIILMLLMFISVLNFGYTSGPTEENQNDRVSLKPAAPKTQSCPCGCNPCQCANCNCATAKKIKNQLETGQVTAQDGQSTRKLKTNEIAARRAFLEKHAKTAGLSK